MEKNVVLEILKSAENLLFCNEICTAKEYIRLQIENLEGITPKKCKSHISKFNYCDKCLNINCPDNKKSKSIY